MTFIQGLISFIIHIDQHLIEIIQIFGGWSYAILFLIVFVETGIVIFPFLPGDSLLFASGAFAAMGAFNIALLLIVFFAAAVIGDTVNYHIGRKIGTSIPPNSWLGRVINQDKMKKAEDFIFLTSMEEKRLSLLVLCLLFVHSHRSLQVQAV